MPTKEATLRNIEEKILFAERLAKMMNDSFTKKEFLDAFERVVNIVVALKAHNKAEIERFRKEYDEAKKELNGYDQAVLEKLSKRLDAYFAEKTALISQKMSMVDERIGAHETKMRDEMTKMEAHHEVMKEEIYKEHEVMMNDMIDTLPQHGEKFRDGLELLQGDNRLDKSAIKGLQEEFERLGKIRAGRVLGGYTDNHVKYALGRIEAVEEEVSFSGTTGTLSNLPVVDSVKLYRGGVRMQEGSGKDYTVSGKTITLATAAISGEIFVCDYLKS